MNDIRGLLKPAYGFSADEVCCSAAHDLAVRDEHD